MESKIRQRFHYLFVLDYNVMQCIYVKHDNIRDSTVQYSSYSTVRYLWSETVRISGKHGSFADIVQT